jgi:hypothetical protein
MLRGPQYPGDVCLSHHSDQMPSKGDNTAINSFFPLVFAVVVILVPKRFETIALTQ